MSTEEIENYFVESAGYGRDKVRNFMDIVNKALKQKGERIAELEAQIEKMKCCENCAKNGHICVAEEMQGKLCGKNKDKWELRR